MHQLALNGEKRRHQETNPSWPRLIYNEKLGHEAWEKKQLYFDESWYFFVVNRDIEEFRKTQEKNGVTIRGNKQYLVRSTLVSLNEP